MAEDAKYDGNDLAQGFRLFQGDGGTTEDIRQMLRVYRFGDGNDCAWDTQQRQERERIALCPRTSLNKKVSDLFANLCDAARQELATDFNNYSVSLLKDAKYFLDEYYQKDEFVHEKVLAIAGMACSTGVAVSFRNGMEAAAAHIMLVDEKPVRVRAIVDSLEASGIGYRAAGPNNPHMEMHDVIFEAYGLVSKHGAHRVTSGVINKFLELKLGSAERVDYFLHRMRDDYARYTQYIDDQAKSGVDHREKAVIRRALGLRSLFQRYFHPQVDVELSMAGVAITINVSEDPRDSLYGADYQVRFDGFDPPIPIARDEDTGGLMPLIIQAEEKEHDIELFTVCNCGRDRKFLFCQAKIKPGETKKMSPILHQGVPVAQENVGGDPAGIVRQEVQVAPGNVRGLPAGIVRPEVHAAPGNVRRGPAGIVHPEVQVAPGNVRGVPAGHQQRTQQDPLRGVQNRTIAHNRPAVDENSWASRLRRNAAQQGARGPGTNQRHNAGNTRIVYY